jgi:hypothetical protein
MPFLALPDENEAYSDLKATRRTHEALQGLDARDDVFLLLSHDDSVDPYVKWFPEEANGWQEEGWKAKSYWAFLEKGNPANRWAK